MASFGTKKGVWPDLTTSKAGAKDQGALVTNMPWNASGPFRVGRFDQTSSATHDCDPPVSIE